MRLAARMSRLGTETAFEVLAQAKRLEARGKDVVHLEIGEPDFATPAPIREAAKRALDEGWTHYTGSAGLPEARAVVAEHVAGTRGIPVDPEQVVIVPGGKPVIFFTILALAEAGDEVLVPDPGYPIYESVARFAGATPVPWRQREEAGFAPDVAELERLLGPKTRLVVLNSPSNPTGGMLDEGALARIAKALERWPDVWVLADEIYSEILYEGRHRSIASFGGLRDRTVILDGFSKTYAMTGWRAGYAVAPEAFAPALTRLMTNSNSCTAAFVQRACIEALRGPQDAVRAMVAEFKKRRDVMVERLGAIPGIRCTRPKGAFYAFPNVEGLGLPSQELQKRLLEEAGVACLSGTVFGRFGEGFLRLSYANSIPNIEKALDRIAGFVSKLPRRAAAPR